MENIPDSPYIRNMEASGWPGGKAPEVPQCPVCGAECDTIYRNRDSEIVGCEQCIHIQDAYGVDECFPRKE